MPYANHVLGSIPFGHVIGGPMVAAVEAQALAAQTSVNFIREVGFAPPPAPAGGAAAPAGTSGDFGSLREVTFTYTRRRTDPPSDDGDGDGDGDGGGAAGAGGIAETTATITVPLLTIVPIPYLRIDDMTIDFTSKITEELIRDRTSTNQIDTNAALTVGYGAFFTPVKVNFNASISTKHSSTTATSNRYKTEHTMNIHVRAVQDDLPAGITRILDMLEAAIRETDSGDEA